MGIRKLLRMVDLKIISNKEYQQMRKDEFKIYFGFHQSPFGKCLIGLHGTRICHLSFVNSSESVSLNVLKSQWPHSAFVKENIQTGEVIKRIFNEAESCEVLLKGTEFEARVWQSLLTIPRGKTVSYEEVARMAGRGKAVRAAANAVAKNFVSYLVPCHRVIRKNGNLHKYQGGPEIKRKILEFENCAI